MNILVTGGFGNIGLGVIKEATKRGHDVIVYEKFNKANNKMSQKHKDHYKSVIWGDIRNLEQLYPAVRDADVIIHLASLIPPESEKDISVTHDVNTKGLENVINSIIISKKDIKLVHLSSISVVGFTQEMTPPVKIDSPYHGTNHYSVTKIACEEMLDVSKVTWCILRPANVISAHQKMSFKNVDALFTIPLDYRMETIFDDDVIDAILNAAELMVNSHTLDRKKLFLGGGEKKGHWHIYRSYIETYLSLLKLKVPPDRFFSKEKTYHDWYDTEEAQNLLHFQNGDYHDFIKATSMKHKKFSALSKVMDYIFKVRMEKSFLDSEDKRKGIKK
ncbi:MAG: NAD(P)-dependent oxidoreductase [Clostridia bacterium]|nr:NAD(P)-dependent oxidoreductase [Clostridia bacterium]